MAIWVMHNRWEGVAMGERLLSRSDVADLLRIPPRLVTEWAKRGLIPSVLLPNGERRYRPEEIRLKAREIEMMNNGYECHFAEQDRTDG